MHGLLRDLIAAEPDEVHPVVHLILRVAHLRLTRPVPDAGGAVAGGGGNDLTNRPLADLVNRPDVVGLAAILRAGDDARAVGCRHRMSLQTDPVARGINAGGLLRKHMLAGGHRVEHIPRAEAGRGSHDHHVDFRVVKNPAVGVEALVDLGVGQLHLAFVGALHRLPHLVSLGGVEVSRCHQLDVVVNGERVVDGPRPTATTADDRQPQFAGLLSSLHRRVHSKTGSHRGGGGGSQESSTCGLRNGVFLGLCGLRHQVTYRV